MVLEYKVLLPFWNWLGTRGRGNLHRAPPRVLASGEKWTRSAILLGGFRWHCGYRICGGCERDASLGRAKTSLWDSRKQFLGVFLAAPAAMVEIPAGLKTRPAWWQLDHLDGRWPAWLPRLGLVVCHGIADCQAHGDDLLLRPDMEGEGEGYLAEDGVGAVVEWGGGMMPPHPTQTRRALRRSARSLLASWRLELCLGKENQKHPMILKQLLK
jgi:hypothetical protein